ncbi:hypothetical protein ACFWXK_04300 [Streptomyces sp. NPDC059070]|uniref:hypothetical protein n=1 Tax=Streptomyces sp. NPDC059070 TaxID=3346713 RepID=UPI0036B95BFE
MQRTRTAVGLLAGVAVLAASGCVTVERGPAHGPPPPPPERAGERPALDVRPQIVQAPVREALDAVLPPDPAPRAAAPAPVAPPRPRPRAAAPRPRPAPRPARPAPVPVPVPSPLIGDDVCDLGRSLGGWRPGSPEARICEESYGR